MPGNAHAATGMGVARNRVESAQALILQVVLPSAIFVEDEDALAIAPDHEPLLEGLDGGRESTA